MTLPNGYRFPDVSRYRTVCTWGSYDNYPASSCKATEGSTRRDPSFGAWYSNMRTRGLFPIPYHFLRSELSVSSQVSNFLNTVDDGKPFGIMLDVENSGVGTRPTIAQANEWCNRVRDATGIPRSSMLVYLPRWWYQAFGGGDTRLSDTICHNSHFSNSPFTGSYAGWDKVDVIQYSSTAPIDGLCAPGTGDMNVAIGMTAEQFKSKLVGVTPPVQEPILKDDDMPFEMHDGKRVCAIIGGSVVSYPTNDRRTFLRTAFANAKVPFPQVNVDEEYFNRIQNAASANVATVKSLQDLLNKQGVEINELQNAVAGISAGAVDVPALAMQLAPLLPALSPADIQAVRGVVDSELDKRNISLTD
jgi:glycosyl hydrolase family 25